MNRIVLGAGAPQNENALYPRYLFSRRLLGTLIQRERSRADRTNGQFSLVIFRLPEESEEPAIVELMGALSNRARISDDVGYLDRRAAWVLLDCTGEKGAARFAQEIRRMFALRDWIVKPVICTYPSRRTGNGESANGRGAQGQINGNGRHGNPNGNGAHHSSYHHGGNGHNGAPDAENSGDCEDGGLRCDDAFAAAMLTTDLRALGSYELDDGRLSHPELGGSVLLDVDTLFLQPLPRWKRLMDLLLSATALVALSPLFVLIAGLVKFTSPGPIIFRQKRSGWGGRPFVMFKFRTMDVDAEQRKGKLAALNEQDGPAFKLRRDPRVTRVGRFLRASSLDELPQFWNVFKGEMTLIGPRPLPCAESDGCELWQRRRLDVTPGLSCIWQVHGRSRVSFDEWMRMDIRYIQRRSWLQDMKILIETVPAVIWKRSGH